LPCVIITRSSAKAMTFVCPEKSKFKRALYVTF
jgi:hypothetical protein